MHSGWVCFPIKTTGHVVSYQLSILCYFLKVCFKRMCGVRCDSSCSVSSNLVGPCFLQAHAVQDNQKGLWRWASTRQIWGVGCWMFLFACSWRVGGSSCLNREIFRPRGVPSREIQSKPRRVGKSSKVLWPHPFLTLSASSLLMLFLFVFKQNSFG